ncbi:histidinol-phosphate aminotransferase [Bacillus sp. Leaf406]|nr:histidinol-phosphate aminotransferase [Bacillus sp. Leaf406]
MVMKFKTREVLTKIDPYVLGKSTVELQREHGLGSICKLSENENIHGCSPKVVSWLKEGNGELFLYPDGAATELRKEVSEFLGVRQGELVFGNGSDEVIRLLSRAYISEGDEAIMADVTFPRYHTNVFLEGGNSVRVPLVNGVHDLAGMKNAITDRTKLIFICNPNNPTGTIVGTEELLSFISAVPSHILLVLDEAYVEYVSDRNQLDTLPLLKRFENLVILRTFSKIYGLAGLRVGFGVMNEEVAGQLLKVKDVFNVNALAQGAAVKALHDQAFIGKCASLNEAGRSYLEGEFHRLGLVYFPSQANFIMVDTGKDGNLIAGELAKKGFLVRSGVLLGYPETIRVTIGTEQDNRAFVKALEYVLGRNISGYQA